MSNSGQTEQTNVAHGNVKVGIDSVKVMAESVGIGNLDESSLSLLSENVTFVLKLLLQDSRKFMHKNNHLRLTPGDVEVSMRTRGFQPIFGFYCKEPIPFRMASGSGGKDIFFVDEKEIELSEIINSPLPKVPLEISMRAHWLAIEGTQPLVPENPVPSSSQPQLEPKNSLGISKTKESKKSKFSKVEKVQIKEVTTHELSIEQQLYLKEVTEACVGSDESRRIEALNSLNSDTGLHQMLPRLCNFISEGVKINTVQNNLALLIYLMRMTKALVDNQTFQLEKYLHELLPSILTCIISRQLCLRPDVDNHWALRDFAARLLSQVCKTFNSSTNQLQSRITKIFSSSLQNETAPLATHYGAVVGLVELGTEVVKTFILPHLLQLSAKLSSVLESSLDMIVSNVEKKAAENLQAVCLKFLPPVLKTLHNFPEKEEFKTEYGVFLGSLLFGAVLKLKQPSSSLTSSNPLTSSLLSRGTVLSINSPRPQLPSQLIKNPTSIRTHLLSPTLPSPSISSPGPQKVLVISQPRLNNPNLPLTSSSSSSSSSSGHQVVRLIPTSNSIQITKINPSSDP